MSFLAQARQLSLRRESSSIVQDFTLPGYTSNRIDALDAQNQQVQIELQRLSYKINLMDLDEESFEPES
ncbi:hypothetical protein Lal_00014158 [Lupinus albus]|nr:hypothetical protein Lal_00014158 [Lupinus albus]